MVNGSMWNVLGKDDCRTKLADSTRTGTEWATTKQTE